MHLHIHHSLHDLFSSHREHKEQEHAIGAMALILVIIAGSTSTPFTKQLSDVFSPLSLLFFSEATVLTFTVLSFGFIPLLKSFLKMRSEDILPLLGVSVINSVIAPVMVFTGIQQTNAVNAELFLRSQTLFLLLLAGLILKEKINKWHFVSAGIVVLGLIVVALQGFTASFALQSGDMLILSGALLYAFSSAMLKKHMEAVHPQVVLFLRGIVALSFFFAISPFLTSTFIEEVRTFPLTLIPSALGYSVISCFLGLFCYYEAIERLDAKTISVFLPLMSIGSMLFSHVYLGETIYLYHVIGALFIISGTICMQLHDSMFMRKDAVAFEQYPQKHV